MAFIYDNNGALKYTTQDLGDTVTVLDSRGNLLYRYNKSTNMTLDKNGSLVMRGCILPDLK